MEPLHLFAVFHANLDFSAIPDRDVPVVIDRCYWPLLELVEELRIPVGIELPARTLLRLAEEEPEWVKALRSLAGRGGVEVVGSGHAQLIAPLVPVDVNRANLRLGRGAYEALLGESPTTWFVPEQTVSRGILPLFAEVGAKAVVVEWNNAATCRPELRALRTRSPRLLLPGGRELALLFNDSVVFQKVQRVAHGEIPAAEALRYVGEVHRRHGGGALCLYGGDLEIFDYRPGHAEPKGAASGLEMARLRALFGAFADPPLRSFVLPREAARRAAAPERIAELTHPAAPILCKKQPRYNPTRWAVSGRDGLRMNGRCFALRRLLRAAGAGPELDRELVSLWRSDLRTRATEEKLEAFEAGAAELRQRAEERLSGRVPALGGEDAVLYNPWPEPWEGHPVELSLRLPPGRLPAGSAVRPPAEGLAEGDYQLEVQALHRDGTVRRAALVLRPRLAPGAQLRIRLRRNAPGAAAPPPAPGAVARLLRHRGGALASLRFPGIPGPARLGTIAHGSFDHVAYSPDFYSFHLSAVGEGARQITDLRPVRAVRILADGPIRRVVRLEVDTGLGRLSKVFRIYRGIPRLDVVYGIGFREARVRSLRLGTVTCLPDAFCPETLALSTVQGGEEIEHFPLGPGLELAMQRPVSPLVTASGCLGATEGWVVLSDRAGGVLVAADHSEAAVVPMVEFRHVDGRPFLRLHHSAAESDETREVFFRGFRRFSFAVVGGPGVEALRPVGRAIERGLVARTEAGVVVARGL